MSRLKIGLGFVFCWAFTNAFSQQNFFNVPSLDISGPKKIFVQEQLNINQVIQSNLTFDIGLGKGFQIGFNALGIDFYDSKRHFSTNQPGDLDIYEPLFLLNGQKTFHVNDELNIGLGSNQGANVDVATKQIRFASFNYLNFGGDYLNKNVKFVFGLYYGNKEYFEKADKFGAMVGMDINLLKNKLHLVGDWISGDTPASVGVLGLMYYVHKKIPFSLGWQFPNVRSNSSAVVFEFTFIQ